MHFPKYADLLPEMYVKSRGLRRGRIPLTRGFSSAAYSTKGREREPLALQERFNSETPTPFHIGRGLTP